MHEIAEHLPIDSTVPEDFRQSVTGLMALAMSAIHDEFDTQLPQHNTSHTLDTLKETVRILEYLRSRAPNLVGARDVWLGALVATYHDRVEAFSISGEGIEQTRTMQRWSNEHGSTDLLIALMVGVNQSHKREIFTSDDFETVTDGIDRTVPDFIEVDGNYTVHQHTEGARAIAIALLFADVNAAGSNSKRFHRDGDRLLLEQFPYIEGLVKTLGGAAVGTRDIILDWTGRQIQFAQGRKSIIADEIYSADIPLSLKELLVDFFTGFEESISSSKQRLTERVAMDVRGLLKSLRETVFTPSNQ
jgi:hypothetical protein